MSGVFDDHLGLDAIVAYVDGELTLTAFQRAAAHVVRCPQCASEVAEQEAVARCLRSAELPRMPGSLFDALASIPLAAPRRDGVGPATPGAGPGDPLPPGLPRAAGPRRFRLGAGALVAGLAVGAVVAATPAHPRASTPRSRGTVQQISTGGVPDVVVVPAGLRR